MTRVIDHLQKLVDYYPASNNQPAVKRALTYCQNILEETRGFQDAVIHHINGVYSLTASTQGTKKPKLLLQAHVDVVPAPSEMCKLSRSGDNLCGRGVYDMLFAVASYLALIEKHRDQLSKLDLGLMLTGDEEIGGFQGAEALLERGYACAVCLLPDAGDGFGDLNSGGKGVFNFDLVVSGQAHHGSRPWEGDGAANKLVFLLHEILNIFNSDDREDSTVTITRLDGGDADNKGPGKAGAHLDIRYRDDKDYASIKQRITKLSKRYDAEMRRVMTGDDYKLDMNNKYIRDFLSLYREHADRKITITKAHGSSDARFFTARGMPVIMLRPDGANAHGDHESLSAESLSKFCDLVEAFILKTAKIEE